MKIIQRYEYQSCKNLDWDGKQAHNLCTPLKDQLINVRVYCPDGMTRPGRSEIAAAAPTEGCRPQTGYKARECEELARCYRAD